MTTDRALAVVKPQRVLEAPSADGACYEFRVDGPRPFYFLTENGRVGRVSVTEPGLRTAKGVGVGDTVDAVRQAYGARLVKQPAPYDDAPAHDLVLWTSPGHGLRFEIGQDGKVILIHAGGPAIQYIEGCL